MRIAMKRPPSYGSRRYRHRFLWWPKVIGWSLRWLSVEAWEERYGYGPADRGHVPEGPPRLAWYAIRWANEPEQPELVIRINLSGHA